MEEKIKKHVKILQELRRRRISNNRYRELNDCEATPYMDGSNKIIDDMIVFIEKLWKILILKKIISL